MEAKDLMIGDWLYTKVNRENVRVKGIRIDCNEPAVLSKSEFGELGDVWNPISDFEPIHLTSEILKKNGFVKMSESPIHTEYRLCVDDESEAYLFVDFRPRIEMVHVCYDPSGTSLKVVFSKYEMSVHDLQHAMRMCGIEKEIEL